MTRRRASSTVTCRVTYCGCTGVTWQSENSRRSRSVQNVPSTTIRSTPSRTNWSTIRRGGTPRYAPRLQSAIGHVSSSILYRRVEIDIGDTVPVVAKPTGERCRSRTFSTGDGPVDDEHSRHAHLANAMPAVSIGLRRARLLLRGRVRDACRPGGVGDSPMLGMHTIYARRAPLRSRHLGYLWMHEQAADLPWFVGQASQTAPGDHPWARGCR